MKIWVERNSNFDRQILGEILDFVRTHVNNDGVELVVVGEFTNVTTIPFTVSLLLENGQLCYCKTPLERDLSNWQEVCSKLCLGYNNIIEEVNRNETYPCKFNGRDIQFSKVYGTYIFSDEECEKLAKGERIFFVTDTLPNEDGEQYKYVAVGRLEQADYEGEDNDAVKLVGFRRYGFVKDISYSGLRPYFKRGQLFTREELAKLLNGEEIIHEFINKNGNNSKVKISYDHGSNEMHSEFINSWGE